jgi:predicted NBD/HSP70 family sugar kinase
VAFIGADIGVGHISVVAVDLAGRPFKSRSISFEPKHGEVSGTVGALATVLRTVMKQLPPAQTLHGICVAVPGLVDRDGVILRAPVLGWNAVPILKLLSAKLKWSGVLTAENDANAFAAAELHGQSPFANSDALFVYLDAGIGGGLVSKGRLLRGHSGYAGEIGHILLGDHGFDPLAPLHGSFESFVGRNAVLARYKEQGGTGTKLEDFLAAVVARTPAATRTISEWAWWLGRGIASLVSTLDPGRIVLGGPVAALYAYVQIEVTESISKHLVQPSALPRVELSTLGTDVCAIGGALMLHRCLLAIDERIVYGGTSSTSSTSSPTTGPVSLVSS